MTRALSFTELQSELARTRDLLRTERSNCDSLRVIRDQYKDTIKALELQMVEADAWRENAERELAYLRTHPVEVPRRRQKLPDERWGLNWHVLIGGPQAGVSPHVHLNRYPDGRLGEVFIELDDKERHVLGGGWADAAAMLFSVGLQYGAPVEELALKLKGLRGGPEGPVWYRPSAGERAMSYGEELAHQPEFAPDPDVSRCCSLLDAIAKKILVKFCGYDPFLP